MAMSPLSSEGVAVLPASSGERHTCCPGAATIGAGAGDEPCLGGVVSSFWQVGEETAVGSISKQQLHGGRRTIASGHYNELRRFCCCSCSSRP